MIRLQCEYGFEHDRSSRFAAYLPCSLEKGHAGPHRDGYGRDNAGSEKLWRYRHEIAKDNEIAELRQRLEATK